MRWIDVNYMDPKLGQIGSSKLPDVPGGWWVVGTRDDTFQSRPRPFTLSLVAATSKERGGISLFEDTGEAFSYFERGKTPSMPTMGSALPMAAMALMGFPMAMPDLPMPEMPLPDHGRPLRAFSSVGDYLDGCAVDYMGGEAYVSDVGLIKEELLGEPDVVAVREREEAAKARAAYAEIDGVLAYRVNKYVLRTVMRTYEVTGTDGFRWRVVLGAAMEGHDMLVFRRGSVPGGVDAPFGRCDVSGAMLYDVEWAATRRFGGCGPVGHEWSELIGPWCRHMYSSAAFSDVQMSAMRAESKRLSAEATARHERDMEGLRRLESEMHEQNRRRQERLDWERARSWERKQASDRRIREGWSAVIRGVEQYRGPYGELIEAPVSGPGYHAYYDRLSGTVLHTDRYMGGAWEELPRWEW